MGNVSLTITNVTNNTGTASSAGIDLSTSSTISFTLMNSNIDNNTLTNPCSYDCSDVRILPSDVSGADVTATITGCTTSGNSARNGGGYSGGATIMNSIYGSGRICTVTDINKQAFFVLQQKKIYQVHSES